MSTLNAKDLASISEALRLLTAATKSTGIRFDGPGNLDMTSPSGDYLTVRWADSDDGQYVLDLNQY